MQTHPISFCLRYVCATWLCKESRCRRVDLVGKSLKNPMFGAQYGLFLVQEFQTTHDARLCIGTYWIHKESVALETCVVGGFIPCLNSQRGKVKSCGPRIKATSSHPALIATMAPGIPGFWSKKEYVLDCAST